MAVQESARALGGPWEYPPSGQDASVNSRENTQPRHLYTSKPMIMRQQPAPVSAPDREAADLDGRPPFPPLKTSEGASPLTTSCLRAVPTSMMSVVVSSCSLGKS